MKDLFKKYFLKFLFRLIVALITLFVYIEYPEQLDFHLNIFDDGLRYIHILWLILFIESASHLLPRKNILVGCGKQFSINYKGTEERVDELEFYKNIREMNIQAMRVFIVWTLANLLIILIYVLGYIGNSEMLMLCMFYYVGDMVCVVFYCPFQSILMKNRCCSVCRIYSWDQIFLFTPFLFIRSFFSWSLASIAIIIFMRWEYMFLVYPERFQESTNVLLRCRNCQDRICRIRKPVHPKKHNEHKYLKRFR